MLLSEKLLVSQGSSAICQERRLFQAEGCSKDIFGTDHDCIKF